MAEQCWRSFASLIILFLTLHSAFSADSPAPDVGADTNYPISYPPVNSPASSLNISIPPATKQSDSPSPSPAPETSPSMVLSPPAYSDSEDASPSPAPVESYRASNSIAAVAVGDPSSGGRKAGTVFGVLIGAGVVVLAGIIYKKRRDNIQRSRYGYATPRELV